MKSDGYAEAIVLHNIITTYKGITPLNRFVDGLHNGSLISASTYDKDGTMWMRLEFTPNDYDDITIRDLSFNEDRMQWILRTFFYNNVKSVSFKEVS